MKNNIVSESAPGFKYFGYYAKPMNINSIVRLQERFHAAWLVFTGKAMALRWYSYKEAEARAKNKEICQHSNTKWCSGELWCFDCSTCLDSNN